MPEPIDPSIPVITTGRTIPGWLKPVSLVAGVIALVGVGFWLGNNYRLDFSNPLRPGVIATNSLSGSGDPLFQQVEYLMRTKFLNASDVSEEDLRYGAIAGMVQAAGDPYTNFFDPENNKQAEDQLAGNYQGIGAELGYNANRQLVVIAPLKDSPAQKAGIKAGDIIAKIDDQDSLTMAVSSAVRLIRGEAGSEVTLTVVRSGQEPQAIAITRDNIKVNSIDLSYKDNPNKPAGNQEVAYLRLSRFGDTTIEEWDAAVDEIKSSGATSMVLDLRDNPGGYLDAAIYIGSEFFTDGQIVGQQDTTGKVQKFNVDHKGRLTDMPVVVLVNGGSASAAEIVSGALKSRGRAEVVGVKSFGKGTVQQVVDLPNGTSLHVTIAKWLLPDGANIHQVGIAPTQEVTISDDQIATGQDPQLDAAILTVSK